MKKRIFTLFLISLFIVESFCSIASATTVRVKDIAHVNGIRDNQLVGYGLVTGLSNTGDGNSILDFLILAGLGAIGGISMIFPGISGSMVMLVLGKYEMIRGYIDKVTTLDINIYIKLVILAIGAIIGVIISSKILSKVLDKHRGKTISLILGFIIASALILPLNLETKLVLSTEKICGLIVSFVLGGVLIYLLDRLEKKNSD